MDDSQEKARCDMILGWGLLSELKVDLCISKYIVKLNEGKYEGCMTAMKDVNKVHVKFATEQLDDERFWD